MSIKTNYIPKEIYLKVRPYIIGFWIFEAISLFGLNTFAVNLFVKDQSFVDSLISYFQYFFQWTYWMLFALFVLKKGYLIHNPQDSVKLKWFIIHVINFILVFVIGFFIEYLYQIIIYAKSKALLDIAGDLFVLYFIQLGTFVLKYLFIMSIAQTVAYFSYMKNKEAERYEIEIEFAELKYQFLVSQIKPHFIFNANHAIISLIEQGEVAKSSDMLIKLSNLLRNILNFSNRKFILLQEELANLTTYVQIQQIRFDFSIEFNINCDVNLHNFEVPPLILQPIVENCFNYAFADKASGKIFINCFQESKSIILQVVDNGNGIKQKKSNFGIGLDNVRKRIELAFGADVKLDITSNELNGTSVSIIIPKYD